MHEGEVEIDVPMVQELIREQFPHLADLAVEPVVSTGTVNAIYRIGTDLYARLPRLAGWSADLLEELEWLPFLRPHLSLAIPEPVAQGGPGPGYPLPWAIYRWVGGDTYAIDRVHDERRAAADLAQFVVELRRIDPSGGPASGRLPLDQLDLATRAAIEQSGSVIDADRTIAAWERALRAPAWEGSPVWRHCDLLPPNLIVEGGRLKAVIDFGSAGVGDPAADVIPAWSVFGERGRAAFRHALDVDEGTWARARGVALHQALLIIPYYRETNPGFVAMATRTVQQVLADLND
jgi:aminoglycoside phosphotransferase (APT) family kinase protein